MVRRFFDITLINQTFRPRFISVNLKPISRSFLRTPSAISFLSRLVQFLIIRPTRRKHLRVTESTQNALPKGANLFFTNHELRLLWFMLLQGASTVQRSVFFPSSPLGKLHLVVASPFDVISQH